MNENELKLLWQSAHEKLEDNLLVNRKNTEDITRLKAKNFLSSMKPIKIFTLIVGILWVAILGPVVVQLFIHAYDQVSLYFLYAAATQVVLTAIAVVVYIYQLDLIYKIDFSEPVLNIQEKLSKLKVSTLNVTRILFLQLPVWTIFYWNDSMFENGNLFLWIIQIIITLAMSCLAIWLFFHIKFENRDQKWFKLIFSGKEWQPMLQSMELLSQIEVYQGDENENTRH
ncbi:MAG: hypothetical protein RIR11_793 [Bacteroidota bacterium]|jgi:hypothetical protein